MGTTGRVGAHVCGEEWLARGQTPELGWAGLCAEDSQRPVLETSEAGMPERM